MRLKRGLSLFEAARPVLLSLFETTASLLGRAIVDVCGHHASAAFATGAVTHHLDLAGPTSLFLGGLTHRQTDRQTVFAHLPFPRMRPRPPPSTSHISSTLPGER